MHLGLLTIGLGVRSIRLGGLGILGSGGPAEFMVILSVLCGVSLGIVLLDLLLLQNLSF